MILLESTTIIENLQATLTATYDAVAYFYCDHRNPKKQSVSNFFNLLLVQLSQRQPGCIDDIKAAYSASKRKLTDERRLKIVKAVLAHFRRVIVVVDALDESLEEEAFAHGFSGLLETGLDSDTVVQVILTSREDLNVERSIETIATSSLSLGKQMEDDIRTYISSEVKGRLRSKKMKLANLALVDEIVRSIVERADGMCVFWNSHVQRS